MANLQDLDLSESHAMLSMQLHTGSKISMQMKSLFSFSHWMLVKSLLLL
jgi:hypothetical protein